MRVVINMADKYKFLFFALFLLSKCQLSLNQDLPITVPPTFCALQAGTQLPQYFDVLKMICKPCTDPYAMVIEAGK